MPKNEYPRHKDIKEVLYLEMLFEVAEIKAKFKPTKRAYTARHKPNMEFHIE